MAEKIWYHGSPVDFEAFELQQIPTVGTNMGFGVYLTDDGTRAERYTGNDNGIVYTVDFEPGREMFFDELTLSRDEITELVGNIAKQQIENDGYPYILSDWDEPTKEWSEQNDGIVSQIVDSLSELPDDVELLNSLNNELGGDAHDKDSLIQAELTKMGVTHSTRMYVGVDGETSQETVVFNPANLKIVTKRPLKEADLAQNEVNRVLSGKNQWDDDSWTQFVSDNVQVNRSQAVIEETTVQLDREGNVIMQDVRSIETEQQPGLNRLNLALSFENVDRTQVISFMGDLNKENIVNEVKKNIDSAIADTMAELKRDELTPAMLHSLVYNKVEAIYERDESNFDFMTFPAAPDYLFSDFDLGTLGEKRWYEPIPVDKLNDIQLNRRLDELSLKEFLQDQGFDERVLSNIEDVDKSHDYPDLSEFRKRVSKFIENDAFNRLELTDENYIQGASEPNDDGFVDILLWDKNENAIGTLTSFDGNEGSLSDAYAVDDLTDELYNKLAAEGVKIPEIEAQRYRNVLQPLQNIENEQTFTYADDLVNWINTRQDDEFLDADKFNDFLSDVNEDDKIPALTKLLDQTSIPFRSDDSAVTMVFYNNTEEVFVEDYATPALALMDSNSINKNGEAPDLDYLQAIDKRLSQINRTDVSVKEASDLYKAFEKAPNADTDVDVAEVIDAWVDDNLQPLQILPQTIQQNRKIQL
jgi:hypothetical protein